MQGCPPKVGLRPPAPVVSLQDFGCSAFPLPIGTRCVFWDVRSPPLDFDRSSPFGETRQDRGFYLPGSSRPSFPPFSRLALFTAWRPVLVDQTEGHTSESCLYTTLAAFPRVSSPVALVVKPPPPLRASESEVCPLAVPLAYMLLPSFFVFPCSLLFPPSSRTALVNSSPLFGDGHVYHPHAIVSPMPLFLLKMFSFHPRQLFYMQRTSFSFHAVPILKAFIGIEESFFQKSFLSIRTVPPVS